MRKFVIGTVVAAGIGLGLTGMAGAPAARAECVGTRCSVVLGDTVPAPPPAMGPVGEAPCWLAWMCQHPDPDAIPGPRAR